MICLWLDEENGQVWCSRGRSSTIAHTIEDVTCPWCLAEVVEYGRRAAERVAVVGHPPVEET